MKLFILIVMALGGSLKTLADSGDFIFHCVTQTKSGEKVDFFVNETIVRLHYYDDEDLVDLNRVEDEEDYNLDDAEGSQLFKKEGVLVDGKPRNLTILFREKSRAIYLFDEPPGEKGRNYDLKADKCVLHAQSYMI